MLPGPEVALRDQEGAELGRRQRCPASDHDARHHLVASHRIGHPVHRRLGDGGMAQQGPLDRRGAEVLPVDAQPLARPPGEPAEPVGVRIAQVAAPVHAVANPARVGLRVMVVPGKQAGTRRVHQLADGFGRVEQLAAGTEPGRRARAAGLRVQDGHPVGQLAQCTRWGAGGTADRHAALGRPEPVDHRAAEPLGEPGQVGRRSLVAVGDAERVVGVVGTLRRGQHVAERLAHVVRVGHAERADVGEEPGRGKPATHRDRRARGQADRPARSPGSGLAARASSSPVTVGTAAGTLAAIKAPSADDTN